MVLATLSGFEARPFHARAASVCRPHPAGDSSFASLVPRAQGYGKVENDGRPRMLLTADEAENLATDRAIAPALMPNATALTCFALWRSGSGTLCPCELGRASNVRRLRRQRSYGDVTLDGLNVVALGRPRNEDGTKSGNLTKCAIGLANNRSRHRSNEGYRIP